MTRIPILVLLIFISSYGIAQSGALILNEDLVNDSKVFTVEEPPHKRIVNLLKLKKYKFGNYELMEGKRNWGSTSTQKQTKNGNQGIDRSKFKFTMGNGINEVSFAKVVKESKYLIYDNETFLELLFPAIGSTIPSYEDQTITLLGTLSINQIPNSEWQFVVKKIIDEKVGNTFEMYVTKADRRITIQMANTNGELGLIKSGFEFFENNQSLGALYVGLPNMTIWFKNHLDLETEIVLATMMACLMTEYQDPLSFINSN